MARSVYADEITAGERSRLLSTPFSELRHTATGREVITYHSLSGKQFGWLARELGYKPASDSLQRVLDAISRDDPVYSTYPKQKRSGGVRKILVPMEPLKEVQRRILDKMLTLYPVSESAFGYSGGSVFDAIKPHLVAGNGSLFSTDIEDAFGSVRFEAVFEALYGLPMYDNYEYFREPGYLSWEVAYALCLIVTCDERLPQGAPSSPRLFDMVFKPIDRRLERLARKVKGTYTRFADNIYFSMPQSEFPRIVARAVIRTIHENRSSRRGGLMDANRFQCHKTCARPLGGEAIRVLGVNVASGEIHLSRQLKRRIRLSIHRMNWLLANTPDDLDSTMKCWGILQGQMSFASQCWGTLRGQLSFASQAGLPGPLQKEYDRTRRNYEGLIFGANWPP
jgi:hypothetical protein